MESGEDTGSEVEETFDNCSRVSLLPPSSRIPRTCTVLHANLFIATPTRNAYPDTQAEVSITNTPEHVVRKHSKSARVQGLLGKSQIAQYADLAFRLKTDKGRHITLRIRKPGLFLPEAKEILLAHQDLEDSGFRVNYHTGKMRAPRGQMITMVKSGAVWQIPVMSPPKHTVLAATTTAPTNVTPSLKSAAYRQAARAQRRYMRMRRTCTTRTFLVRVVQTSSPNASSSQAHGPPSTALLIGHQSRKRKMSTVVNMVATARYKTINRPVQNTSRSQLRGSQPQRRRYEREATETAEQMEADLWLRGSVQQQHLHSH